jgi:3-carboxy-cis,cis-muconate cycloisomerase
MTLLSPLFRWDAIDNFFSDSARLQGMLDFEAALARAEARLGVIPRDAAAAITAKCQAQLFDFQVLSEGAALAGNLAIPLVKQLTKLVAADNKEAARFVHWGATSQDAIDTGSILQLRSALDRIDAELERLANSLARIVRSHRSTVLPGRTWLQQALPITFGLKAATWLDAIDRHRARLTEIRPRILVLQFGGAVGTLAALGDKGLAVANALGEELQLAVPPVPWHAHRDRIVEAASTLGLLMGTLGKIARDISLLAQTEIAEVSEPSVEGRGGSSTLPQKRNPVACSVVLSAADRVPGLLSTLFTSMVQEHERGLGGWQAEWEVMPEIVSLVGGALHHLASIADALQIDAAKMSENLDLTRGLIYAEAVQMALAPSLGRAAAHEFVAAAAKTAQEQARSLRDVLAEIPEVASHLSSRDLDRLFDPKQYLGVADQFIDRVLQSHSSHGHKSAGGRR